MTPAYALRQIPPEPLPRALYDYAITQGMENETEYINDSGINEDTEECSLNGMGPGGSNPSLGTTLYDVHRLNSSGQSLPKRVGGCIQSVVGQPPAPEGAGVGGGASLVQYNSITHTAQISPLEIAQRSLDDLLLLPQGDIRLTIENVTVCKGFVEYLDQCEQKGFMLKGYDTKQGKIVKYPLSYQNRWGASRRQELKEKLERLEYWFELQQDRPVTMITFTSFHEGLSVSSQWHELNKSRDKILKLIRKYFGDVDYFWVPEPHESGYVHYHMAVFAKIDNETKDSKGKGIEDKFRDLWSRKYKTGNHTYGLDFSQKQGDGKIQHLKNYLSKYLEKGFLLGKWTPGILIFNAHLWETGFRMYGASRRIREIMNIKDDESSQTVWLETKLEQVVVNENGEEIYDEHVTWARQYIPDWIDSDFWVDHDGSVRVVSPQKTYFYDWGRPTQAYDPVKLDSVVKVTWRKEPTEHASAT